MTQKDPLAQRRDRAAAAILTYKETYCDEHLPDQVARQLRKVILDELNSFYQAAMQASGVLLNEHALRKLDEIHAEVVESRHG
jgi:hypothetical protein